MRIFGFLFLILQFFIPLTLSAKAMHLFLAADTAAENLKGSPVRDCATVEESFSYIAELCNVAFYSKKITSTDQTLTSAHLEAWIKEAHVAPDDILIFISLDMVIAVQKKRL